MNTLYVKQMKAFMEVTKWFDGLALWIDVQGLNPQNSYYCSNFIGFFFARVNIKAILISYKLDPNVPSDYLFQFSLIQSD